MAEKASYWRNHLKTRLTSVTERRRFWERVFRGRFASLMQAGNETAAQQILEDELDNPGSTGGEIILVGAGPGMPGCSRCVASRFYRMRMSCSMTTWSPTVFAS